MSKNQSITFNSYGITHPGNKRDHNEDALLENPTLGLWAVADGMGGHEAGDYASQYTISSLDTLTKPTSLETIRLALHEAHTHLRKQKETCGTTIALLLRNGAQGHIIWAGDSRVYRYRNQTLTQLTRDHSYVEELVENGLLSPSDAKTSHLSNRITRALGAYDELALDLISCDFIPGDRYIICSDGLYNEIEDTALCNLLENHPIDTFPAELLQAVLNGDAKDNVTFILIAVS